MNLSVIIPTYNEADNLKKILPFLVANTNQNKVEIIVSDGGSSDNSIAIAKSYEVTVVKSPNKGRAAQMNYAATLATSEILQFIHADTIPPKSFISDIETAIREGYIAGCFTYRFDSNHLLLKINAFFTRFNKLWCRGGDQAIFIKKTVFEEFGGYPNYLIMEEYELLKQIQAKYPFKIIKNNAVVSARKYTKNGYLKVQLTNLKVFKMYNSGASQKKMATFYKNALKK
jgi:rSAM/selenodomain-associated transferase 2